MIKTVLFDLDDTLLDFHKAEAVALSKALVRLGLEPGQETLELYSAINARQWQRLERREITREQVITERFELLFKALGVERSPVEANEAYRHFLGIGHYFMPGAPELLEELFPRYSLYLVSNGSATVQDSRIESAGISRYFKEIFISQRMGYDKPQVEFFNLCFERIPGLCRDTTIIVGDSLTSDILGGIRSGIHTCWYNPKKKPARKDIPAEYEVEELSQIPSLLECV